jgi:GxxExxY protein
LIRGREAKTFSTPFLRVDTMSPTSQSLALKHGDITDKVIGCFYDVYNELGFGFLESVYRKAMIIALQQAGLSVTPHVKLPVFFRGQPVGDFEADLFVEGLIIVELKAVDALHDSHTAQLLNYLKATTAEVGMLLNFGPKPKFTRFLFDNARKRSRPPIIQSDSV